MCGVVIGVTTEMIRQRILDFEEGSPFVWDSRFFEIITERGNREELMRLTNDYLDAISKLVERGKEGEPLVDPISIFLSSVPLR